MGEKINEKIEDMRENLRTQFFWFLDCGNAQAMKELGNLCEEFHAYMAAVEKLVN